MGGSRKFDRRGNKRPSRSKKRRFHGNQSTAEADTEFVSKSAKKLETADDMRPIVDESSNYVICHFLMMFNFLSECLVCKSCGSDVKFNRSPTPGVAFNLVIQCSCATRRVPSSPHVSHCFEVNRLLMFAMRLLELGLQRLKTLCSVMDISHTFSSSIYYAFLKNTLVAAKAVFDFNQKKAVEEEIRENTAAGNNPSNLSVSGDGSWKKRGFTSLFGLASLIGKYTGKIVDVVVKSLHCQACISWKSQEGTVEYLAWKSQHEDDCAANHTGSAEKIEVDAVKEMFERSQEKLGVRYENYIGDGDTKTFKAVLELDPYDDLEVNKKECVGHVQKRMGSRLRKVKKETKGLGGKGTGTLTDKLITDLTLYYGLAIRRHPDSAKKMKEAVWVTFFHKISTNGDPQHHFCPQGPESWCKWRVAEAEGTLKNFKHDPPLQKKVQDAIKPVYEALSDDNLLQRCTGGNTQNSNESFNSTVWKLAPKHLHCGQQTVEIATYIAANVFNEGWTSLLKIMNTLGISINLTAYNYAEAMNSDRIRKAEHRLSSAARAAIIASRQQRIQEDKCFEEEEGLMYALGMAD